MRVHHWWSLFFIALTIGAFLFYRAYQPVLTYEFAEAFDGNDYRLAYDFFTGHLTTYEVPPPFHQRILVPFIASIFNNGLISDFQKVNLVFSILSVYVIFLLWRKLGLEFKWIMFGFIWLIFHWSGLIRLNAFDPVTVDVPIYLFHGALMLFLLKRKFNLLLWLAPLATAQKESFIGYMVVLTAYAFWHNRKEQDGFFNIQLILTATGLAVLTKLLITYYFPAATEGRGTFVMLAYQAKELLLDPFELLRWLAAISVAYGVIIWLASFHFIKTRSVDVSRNLLALFTITSLAYGLLAGGDMTRIIFLGFPFVMTFGLVELQRAGIQKFYLLAFLSLPLLMLHSSIPDPAFQWDLWRQWYPEFAEQKLVIILLAYTCLILVLVKSPTLFKKRP